MVTANESTAVATVEQQRKPSAIEQLMTSDQARAYIEPFLPKGTDIQRVAATVMLAIRKDETGTLRRCTGESLILGVARIQQWGLELGVTAHLIPFKNGGLTEAAQKKDSKAPAVYDAVPVADYKGLTELMIATKAVRYVEAREVRDGDHFEYRFGLDSKLEHRPFGGRERLRKPITHVYCVVHLPFGSRAFDVMTAEQVEEIRQRYSKQWKTGPLTAWYAKKTIIRQVAKLLPKNPALAKFFEVLEQDREVETADVAAATAVVEREEDTDDRPRAQVEEETFLDDRWVEQVANERGA
jgi:phage RecT family recombinase